MENKFKSSGIKNHSQLLQASLIFHWVFALLGLSLPPTLNGFTYGGQHKRLKLAWFCFSMHSLVLLVAVIWMGYINIIVVEKVVESYDLGSITNVLSSGMNLTVAFVRAIMQLVVFVKQKCFRGLIQRIGQLERNLLWYYVEYQWLEDDINLDLNFQQRCFRFRSYILWRYGFFLIVFLIFFSYINYHLTAENLDFRDKFLTILLTSALQAKALEFCLFVEVVDLFITSLQGFLKCLKYEVAKGAGKSSMRLLFHEKLMANQFLSNRIWLLVRNIEEYFGVPMLVLFLYNGVSITHTFNWSYISIYYNPQWKGYSKYYLVYNFLIFFIMFVPCWLTQSCIEKYQQFGAILHSIQVNDDLILNYQLREYSLQLKHQQMLFTCSGFFDINLKYYGLMVLSISTYVTILIQFKLQTETEKANVRL